MMRKAEIRDLRKSYGDRPVIGAFRDMIEGVELDNGTKPKYDPYGFSLRALWEGFVGDVEDTLEGAGGDNFILKEEVNSTAFVAVTRMLINSMIIGAYKELPTIGEQLVTNMPSKSRHETIAGFTEVEELKEVKESMPYEDSDLGEKYVTSDAFKKGRLIYITEETIMEDRTGQILIRAQRLGRAARIDKEKTIIHGIMDKNNTLYKPSGVPTAFYSTFTAGFGNLAGASGAPTGFTSARALDDWSAIDYVDQFHPLSIKDDKAIGTKDPVLWNPNILLVPPGKKATALRIANATEVRHITNSGNTVTHFNNPAAGRFKTLSSPYMLSSGVAGAADDWYYGDPKEQFFWQDVWPIQTFAMAANSEKAWERDIVAGYKVRYLGTVFATDYRHWVKVKGA